MCRNFYSNDIYSLEFVGDSRVLVLDLADEVIGEPLPITPEQKEAAINMADDVVRDPFTNNEIIQVASNELEALAKILDIGLVQSSHFFLFHH